MNCGPLPACMDWKLVSAWYACSRICIRDGEKGEQRKVHKDSILQPVQGWVLTTQRRLNNFSN